MYGEFVERTGVYVGIDEFNTIVEVYNNSDVDKDEFCKLWAKQKSIFKQKAHYLIKDSGHKLNRKTRNNLLT